MSGGTVDEETERPKTDGTHDIVWLAIIIDKFLGEHITNGKTGERSECLGEEGLRLKHSIVFCPDSAHC